MFSPRSFYGCVGEASEDKRQSRNRDALRAVPPRDREAARLYLCPDGVITLAAAALRPERRRCVRALLVWLFERGAGEMEAPLSGSGEWRRMSCTPSAEVEEEEDEENEMEDEEE